jgi:hypothetical protein
VVQKNSSKGPREIFVRRQFCLVIRQKPVAFDCVLRKVLDERKNPLHASAFQKQGAELIIHTARHLSPVE